MPTRRGSRCVPPAPGNRPTWTSGNPTAAAGLSASTRWWQASASSKPPPIAAPLIAATTGLPQVSRRRKARDSEPYFSNSTSTGSSAVWSRLASIASRSAPATKASLPEVTMAPLIAASPATRSMPRCRLSMNAWSMTFIVLPG